MRNSSLPVPLAHHVTSPSIPTRSGLSFDRAHQIALVRGSESWLLKHRGRQVVMTLLDKHLEQISQSATAIADLAYAPLLNKPQITRPKFLIDSPLQRFSPTRCCILMISPLLFGILKHMKVLYLPQHRLTLPGLMLLGGVPFTRRKALPQMALVYLGTLGMILLWQHC